MSYRGMVYFELGHRCGHGHNKTKRQAHTLPRIDTSAGDRLHCSEAHKDMVEGK